MSLLSGTVVAQALLENLGRPREGRSMRATSAARKGRDPNAERLGDGSEEGNYDNYNVGPGETHVVLDAQGPGGDHAHVVRLQLARRKRRGCRPPGDASAAR